VRIVMTHLLRAYERGCLRVTLNRPAKRNALSREMLRELKAQALAERFGWPVEARREAEREHFVRTWLDPAHWTAVDGRFEPPAA
jgi:hypothetical protein